MADTPESNNAAEETPATEAPKVEAAAEKTEAPEAKAEAAAAPAEKAPAAEEKPAKAEKAEKAPADKNDAAPKADAAAGGEAAGEDAAAAPKPKKRKSVVPAEGLAHIKATFNNVQITLTDLSGNTISWASSGKMGFKGSRKNTPYAAQVASSNAAKKAYDLGLRRVEVYVKGPGSGRESAIRALATSGLEISTIRDITPIPHNGCRPPKRRRV